MARITVLEAREQVEREARYERPNGYASLTVRLDTAVNAGSGRSSTRRNPPSSASSAGFQVLTDAFIVASSRATDAPCGRIV